MEASSAALYGMARGLGCDSRSDQFSRLSRNSCHARSNNEHLVHARAKHDGNSAVAVPLVLFVALCGSWERALAADGVEGMTAAAVLLLTALAVLGGAQAQPSNVTSVPLSNTPFQVKSTPGVLTGYSVGVAWLSCMDASCTSIPFCPGSPLVKNNPILVAGAFPSGDPLIASSSTQLPPGGVQFNTALCCCCAPIGNLGDVASASVYWY